MSTPSSIEERQSYDLYNRLQIHWNLIVIDIRSYENWRTQHIVNSINIPFDMNLSNDQLIELLTMHQNKKSKIPIGMIYYIISDHNYNYNSFIGLLQNLTHQNIKNTIPFYHLNVSFEDWHKQYPMLCIPDMYNDGNSIIKLNHYKSDEVKEQQYDEMKEQKHDIYHKLLDIIKENTVIYRAYPNCIIDRKLYLGGVNHAQMMQVIDGLNIGYIVNVTNHCKCYFEDIKYFRIPIDDQEYVDIKQYFDDVFAFIDNGMESEKAVLVHCAAGISRSSTIVIGWIMKTKQLKFNDAMDYVKDKREVICPNQGFEKQLKLFEAQLFPQTDEPKTCVIL